MAALLYTQKYSKCFHRLCKRPVAPVVKLFTTLRTNYTAIFKGCPKSSYTILGKKRYHQQCTLISHWLLNHIFALCFQKFLKTQKGKVWDFQYLKTHLSLKSRGMTLPWSAENLTRFFFAFTHVTVHLNSVPLAIEDKPLFSLDDFLVLLKF